MHVLLSPTLVKYANIDYIDGMHRILPSLFLIASVCALLALSWGVKIWPERLNLELSQALGVKVRVREAYYFPSFLLLRGVEIYNPLVLGGNARGVDLPYALSAETVRLTYPNAEGKIEEVALSKVIIGVEFYSRTQERSNWTSLCSRLERSRSAGGTLTIERVTAAPLLPRLLYREYGSRIQDLPSVLNWEGGPVTLSGGTLPQQIALGVFQLLIPVALEQVPL
jgi:hypothetical protein